MTHGYNGYKKGCRCEVCRTASTMKMKQYRVKRVRNGGSAGHSLDGGHLDSPVGPVRKQLQDLHRLMTWKRMGELCGVKGKTLQEIAIRRSHTCRNKNAEAVNSLWQDYCGAVAERDERRYPAAPLIAAVVAKYGSIKALGGSEARRLHHFQQDGTISEAQADRWAMRLLDKMPFEVWDEAS